MAVDVYQKVTDAILEVMKCGKIPWVKPYSLRGVGCAVSHQSREPYSLVNQILLLEPGEYFTFNQAQKEGFRVRKGAKSKFVVFWKLLCVGDDADVPLNDDDTQAIPGKIIPYLKWYNVFHERDIEGFERNGMSDEDLVAYDAEKNAEYNEMADNIINGYANTGRGPKLSTLDCIPHYSPRLDVIECPQKAQFSSLSEYYKTVFHELVHSTGAECRLNRDMSGHFGSHAYSREELVAEIGSAYLASLSALPDQSVKNAVAYIQSWSRVLKDNPRWFVWAASKAEKAVKFIMNEQEQQSC